MFRYIKRIDRQINDTLNVYTELGKMSMPFFKYVKKIISFFSSYLLYINHIVFFYKSESEIKAI